MCLAAKHAPALHAPCFSSATTSGKYEKFHFHVTQLNFHSNCFFFPSDSPPSLSLSPSLFFYFQDSTFFFFFCCILQVTDADAASTVNAAAFFHFHLIFLPIFHIHVWVCVEMRVCFVFLGFPAKLIAYGFVVSCHRHRFYCCCCRKSSNTNTSTTKCLPHTHTHTSTLLNTQWLAKSPFCLDCIRVYGKNK